MRGAALLLAFALAGCLEAPDATPPSASPAPAWSYACPGGPPGPDPCAVRLENATETLLQPVLAAHPRDPARLALAAAAAGAGQSLGPAAVLPALLAGPLNRPQDHPLQPRLFLSEDAGRTWRPAPVPPPAVPFGPAGQIHLQVPLGLAHDGAGSLHALLREVWRNPDGGQSSEVIAHAAFRDGAWGAPTVLGEAGNQALLLVEASAVRVAVSGRMGVAVHASDDAGATWRRTDAPGTEGCRSLAGFLPRPEGPLLACYGQEGPVRLLRAEGSIREVGRLDRTFWRLQLADDGSRLVLFGDEVRQDRNYTLLHAASGDGGGNWSDWRDVLADLPLPEAWGWARLDAAVGAAGHVHLLFLEGPRSDGALGLRRSEGAAHAVFDAAAGRFVQGRELAVAAGSRAPLPLGGDYQSSASAIPAPGGLLLAYGFERGVEVGVARAG